MDLLLRRHGTIPAGHVDEFTRALPALSQGEGVFLSEFDGYRPCPGPPPARPRTGPNPLDRGEYLARVTRRQRLCAQAAPKQ
jgi:ribosomal protection tetracycline resistance protein